MVNNNAEKIADVAGKAASGGFMDTIKGYWDSFSLEQWSEKIAGDSAEVVQAAIFFTGAFLAGFFLKKYFRVLLIGAVFSVGLILLMENQGLLSVNWDACKVFVGLAPTANMNSIFNASLEWIKGNIILTVATVVGFLVGYKLG